jgi:hypothetical protein
LAASVLSVLTPLPASSFIGRITGLATVSALLLLVLDIASKPSLGVGATAQEFDAFIHAQEVSGRQRRLPPRRDFIATTGRPWDTTITTRYYFRDGHYFLTRSVGFEFTNGIVVRIESPYWRWHLDL